MSDGSRDNTRGGAGDHDETFVWGQCPSVAWPLPFTARTFARLLVQRGAYRAAHENGQPVEQVVDATTTADAVAVAAAASLAQAAAEDPSD